MAASLVLNIVMLVPGIGPLIGMIGGLALAFFWVCIYSKRFHDAGQSGWMTIAAIVAVAVVSIVVGLILSPILGGASMASMGSMQAMSLGFVIQNMLTSVIAHAAVGYYMFKLKPVLI